MFERYTETARRTIFFARYEASQFGSTVIGTEHLLLGMLREDRGLALRFLGDESSADEGKEIVPHEVAEAQQRIQSVVQRMENAIANHEFEKAKALSDEERQEREHLRQLAEQYHLTGDAGGFIPSGGRIAEIRRRIESAAPRRPKVSTSQDLPLSHHAKHVLSFGAEEAERMNHRHIGPEHLFLGLLREESCLAAQILAGFGLKLHQVRQELASQPPGNDPPRRPGSVGALPPTSRWAARSGVIYAMQDAGRAVFLARYEAAKRRSSCIETIDLLRALTHEEDVNHRFLGPAQAAIENCKPEPPREHVAAAELPYSEDCNLVFGYAAEEAAQLGQRTGPEHLLLGILRVENCAAAEILRECGLTASGIRAQLSHPPPSSDPEQGRNYV